MQTSTFRHTPLYDATGALRLVQVRGLTKLGLLDLSVRHAPIDTESQYCALSYVWGSDPPTYKIRIDGGAFWIRQNLWSFFTTSYDTLKCGTLLWIDSICINQDDIAEKNLQVPLMSIIFSRAQKVICWLYDTPQPPRLSHEYNMDASQLLVDLICPSRSNKIETLTDTSSEGDNDIAAGALARLLRNPYWSRLWTVQEVQLAQHAEIHWGTHVFDAHALLKLLLSLSHYPELKATVERILMGSIENEVPTLRLNRDVSTGTRTVYSHNSRPWLVELVIQMRHLACSISHDRVYGLLALARDGASMKIDYTESVVELLARLVTSYWTLPTFEEVSTLGKSLEYRHSKEAFQVLRYWKSPESDLSLSFFQEYYPPQNDHDAQVLQLCACMRDLAGHTRGRNLYGLPWSKDPHGFIVGIRSVDFYVGLQVVDTSLEANDVQLIVAFVLAKGVFDTLGSQTCLHGDQTMRIAGPVAQEAMFEFQRDTLLLNLRASDTGIYRFIMMTVNPNDYAMFWYIGSGKDIEHLAFSCAMRLHRSSTELGSSPDGFIIDHPEEPISRVLRTSDGDTNHYWIVETKFIRDWEGLKTYHEIDEDGWRFTYAAALQHNLSPVDFE